MGDSWEKFVCVMPHSARVLLEDELDRIKLLANIDPDDNLSDEVVSGLCLEYIVALSASTPDESII